MAQELGISKRSYIYKIDGIHDWKLQELIKISELSNEDISISRNGSSYTIRINNFA